MKNIKKRDIIVVAVIVVLALVLLAVGLASRKAAPTVDTSKTAGLEVEAQSPAGELIPEQGAEIPEELTAAVDAYMQAYPAESYLVITTSTSMSMPIPLSEEGTLKVHFGEDEYNLIRIDKNYVVMQESTCDNQNCVGQGEITLENRDDRILFNMILCLPHNLSLEMLDEAEARDYLTGFFAAQAVQMAEEQAAEQAAA